MPTNDKPETLTGEQNAGVTIESYAGGPCWIVRDATGVESLLTADRTSAELHAERLRIMGGRWKTAEQLCDMIMEQRRREQPALERLNAALPPQKPDAPVQGCELAKLDRALLGTLMSPCAAQIVMDEINALRGAVRYLAEVARRALEYAPNEVEANVLRAALAKAEGGAK